MAHFAFLDSQSYVQRVIVADQDVIDSGLFGNPSSWVQTSYNTQGGIHRFGGTPLRKNFAGIGYKYDSVRDAFIPPKPFTSWVLDEESCLWNPPTPYPSDNKLYNWDEDALSWVEVLQEV